MIPSQDKTAKTVTLVPAIQSPTADPTSSKAISDLLDLSLPSPVHASATANFVPLNPKNSSTSVGAVDPSSNANGDFGDFSGFQSASPATPVAPVAPVAPVPVPDSSKLMMELSFIRSR